MSRSNDEKLIGLFDAWTGGRNVLSPYRKFIASLIGTALIAAESFGVDFQGADPLDYVAPLTALIVSFLVYAVPNARS
jgi:hypothetical protein